MKNSTLIRGWLRVMLISLWGFGFSSLLIGQEGFAGHWQASLTSPGGGVAFGLAIASENVDGQVKWTAILINGPEEIAVPEVVLERNQLHLKIAHYDSELILDLDSLSGEIEGQWRKRRNKTEWVEMKMQAKKPVDRQLETPTNYLGRWRVRFSSSEDPAVAIFKKAADSNRVQGTFLTTTGDYRFLDGYVDSKGLHLSCFDGAHAFLFRASLGDPAPNELRGEFWSANSWHETWTATRDENAMLPNAFEKTAGDSTQLRQLEFPDLTGQLRRLDDPEFAGKARIIYVFGSWCPNCHDAGNYFAELDERYRDRGLSILGLAFEVTGEFERDAAQVRKYKERHETKYPILVAGLADKDQASAVLPLLDRVRSYPTTIFIDRHGQIRAVHTGFSGPATGSEHARLKNDFESLVETMLNEEK